jgi:hypothetical protein
VAQHSSTLPCGKFFRRQRARLVETGVDLACENGALADATAAVAALVGQVDVLAQAGVEQGFVEALLADGLGGMEGDGRFGLGCAALGRQPGHQEEQPR